MATRGTVYCDVTEWNRLRFTWEVLSQSIAQNSTVISWSMVLTAASYGKIASSTAKNWSVTVDGKSYSGTNFVAIDNNTSKQLASGTTTVKHDADGTKDFSFSFTQDFYVWFDTSSIGSITGSGSGSLPTIARASQPSCITWPDHTQDVGEFGDTISIHMNRKASNLTHTVRYQFGSQSGTIATNVGTGTTWTIPLTLMNLIPNSTTGSGTIYVDTYDGSTKVGTKFCGFTATVPASVKPTCSFTLEDITGIDDIYGSPVKGLSKIKITVNTTIAYSSPIVSVSITANGVKYSGNTATTDFLQTSGSDPITATVTDKRGRTGTVSYTMNVQDYDSPSISKLTVGRCDSDGTANEQGDYVRVTFSAAVTALKNLNTATYVMMYKKSTDTDFTEIPISDLDDVYSVTDHIYVFEADTGASYDVELLVADSHHSINRTTSASTAFTIMHFSAGGTGMGIGKVAEKENTMQIAMDVEFFGKVTGAIFDAIYPVGSIYLAYNHTDPSTLFGGTWERVENRFLWATTAGGTIGQVGGEQTVTLTVDELPSHNHGATYTNAGDATKTHAWLASGGSAMAYESIDTGGGKAHNNMPPYIQVSIWRRTA